jgi:sugar/nucleoside kinase (ribokinase family)
MTQPALDLLALGNAIVDVLANADEAFLRDQSLHKGSMQLIDEARAESLYRAMGPATIVSGGSAANTAVGAAALGARVGFVGKVKDDELGRLFAHDLQAIGVAYDTAAAVDGPATARSFILVTPDGERTMNTYLGASQHLGPDDVDEATVRSPDRGTWRAIFGIRRPRRTPSAKRPASRTRPAIRFALTLSDSFAWTATGPSSGTLCGRARSTFCSPTAS